MNISSPTLAKAHRVSEDAVLLTFVGAFSKDVSILRNTELKTLGIVGNAMFVLTPWEAHMCGRAT